MFPRTTPSDRVVCAWEGNWRCLFATEIAAGTWKSLPQSYVALGLRLTFDKSLPDVALVLERLVVEAGALLLTEIDRRIGTLLE